MSLRFMRISFMAFLFIIRERERSEDGATAKDVRRGSRRKDLRSKHTTSSSANPKIFKKPSNDFENDLVMSFYFHAGSQKLFSHVIRSTCFKDLWPRSTRSCLLPWHNDVILFSFQSFWRTETPHTSNTSLIYFAFKTIITLKTSEARNCIKNRWFKCE